MESFGSPREIIQAIRALAIPSLCWPKSNTDFCSHLPRCQLWVPTDPYSTSMISPDSQKGTWLPPNRHIERTPPLRGGAVYPER